MSEKKRQDRGAGKGAPKERPSTKQRLPERETPTEREQGPERKRFPENVVLVGNKGTMNYVLATVLQFNKGSNDVSIKARGRAISKAVDVAEITRTRFLQDKCKVKKIEIGTEEIKEDDRTRNVSTINIILEK
jgi:DNA-binding protein